MLEVDLINAKNEKRKLIKKLVFGAIVWLIATKIHSLINSSVTNQTIRFISFVGYFLCFIYAGIIFYGLTEKIKEIQAIETLNKWLANEKIYSLLKSSKLFDFVYELNDILVFNRSNQIVLLQLYLTEIKSKLKRQDIFALKKYYQDKG